MRMSWEPLQHMQRSIWKINQHPDNLLLWKCYAALLITTRTAQPILMSTKQGVSLVMDCRRRILKVIWKMKETRIIRLRGKWFVGLSFYAIHSSIIVILLKECNEEVYQSWLLSILFILVKNNHAMFPRPWVPPWIAMISDPLMWSLKRRSRKLRHQNMSIKRRNPPNHVFLDFLDKIIAL